MGNVELRKTPERVVDRDGERVAPDRTRATQALDGQATAKKATTVVAATLEKNEPTPMSVSVPSAGTTLALPKLKGPRTPMTLAGKQALDVKLLNTVQFNRLSDGVASKFDLEAAEKAVSNASWFARPHDTWTMITGTAETPGEVPRDFVIEKDVVTIWTTAQTPAGIRRTGEVIKMPRADFDAMVAARLRAAEALLAAVKTQLAKQTPEQTALEGAKDLFGPLL